MKALVITTSRADWNSLGMVAAALRVAGAAVTVLCYGPHEAAVREDGFEPIGLGTGSAITPPVAAAALLMELSWHIKFAAADVAVICGDRHETLMAAFALALGGVPIAHLAGGDVTGGSLDERWRHAISKIADLHFPTHARAAERLVAMGESNVMLLGSASVSRVLACPLLPPGIAAGMAGLHEPNGPYVLVNWQPEMGDHDGMAVAVIAAAIETCPAAPAAVVWVGANPDEGADVVNREARAATRRHKGWVFHENLEPQLYLSLLAGAQCLVGNSSSAFYEAPMYGTPVVNVGRRQAGRDPVPRCMLFTGVTPYEIGFAVNVQIEHGRYKPEMLYGDGTAAVQIADAIMKLAGTVGREKVFND
jgi:UDP-hydrolysing UDP-N-acetyl-D-glucosamine 2-epimerase